MGHGGRFLGDLKLRQDEVLFGRCGVVKQSLFFFHHHHHTVHCSPPVKLYRDFPASASNTHSALTLLVVRCRLKCPEDGKTCRSLLIPLCALRQYTPYNTYLIGGCSTRICGLRCVILLQSCLLFHYPSLSPSLLYFLQPPLSSHPPATPVFTLTSPSHCLLHFTSALLSTRSTLCLSSSSPSPCAKPTTWLPGKHTVFHERRHTTCCPDAPRLCRRPHKYIWYHQYIASMFRLCFNACTCSFKMKLFATLTHPESPSWSGAT
ncbi:hypothetical protein B0H14DRAFT_636699 [Mycena olivaceomarginata]|nr:hypothetical protein B0H14DRAFT_636699 [Mycena olivaceomarginata]